MSGALPTACAKASGLVWRQPGPRREASGYLAGGRPLDWNPRARPDRLPAMLIGALATAVTTIRLTLHVLAAAIWVGGQFVLAGLLPTVRSLGPDAPKRIAHAFGRLQWPTYAVLLLTGIWNVAASSKGQPRLWKAVLGIKVGVVLLAGLGAFLHQRSRSRRGLAVWGSVAGVASAAALVLGVLLAG